jgi:hypothetical protein
MAEWKHHGPRNLSVFHAPKQQLAATLRQHEAVDLLLEKLKYGATD